MTITPRRLLDDGQPDGYRESDHDFVINNLEACVSYLDGIHVGDTEGDGAGGEAALVIAEAAFRAGFGMARDLAGMFGPKGADWIEAENSAWNAFEPSEEAKAVS